MRSLKRAARYVGIGFVALLVIGFVLDLAGLSEEEGVTPRHFGTVTDACEGFWDGLREVIYTPLADDDAAVIFESIGEGAMSVDVALGSALMAIVSDMSPAEVSANAAVAFRRCETLGWSPPPAQLAELAERLAQPIPAP